MKLKHLILLLILSHSPNVMAVGPKHHRINWLTVAVVATRTADIVTTKIALGRPNTYEANPLFGREPSMSRMVLTEAALGVGLWGMSKCITQLGHPRISRGIMVGSIVGEGLVSVHNAQLHGRVK